MITLMLLHFIPNTHDKFRIMYLIFLILRYNNLAWSISYNDLTQALKTKQLRTTQNKIIRLHLTPGLILDKLYLLLGNKQVEHSFLRHTAKVIYRLNGRR